MSRPAEIIVVTNRKGGTGKTTTSVNLAAEFAAIGKRILLIDMDTQGHCAIGLGIAPAKDASTVHSLFLSSGFRLAEAVYSTAWPNLDLIPANTLFEHDSGGLQPKPRKIHPKWLYGSIDGVRNSF